MAIAKIMAKCPLFAKLLLLMSIVGACTEAHAWSEVVCAGDIPPEGLVVTATGTAPSCNGACRARRIQPVFGEIMKICADQPIPKGYVLDGITTTPACRCLGNDENAYIIKRKPLDYGYDYDQTLMPPQSPMPMAGQTAPSGVPPSSYPYPYPNQNQNQASPYANQQYGPASAAPPGYPNNVSPYGYGPAPMGNYPPYEQEPMRIGE
jgi:hypothetical protein